MKRSKVVRSVDKIRDLQAASHRADSSLSSKKISRKSTDSIATNTTTSSKLKRKVYDLTAIVVDEVDENEVLLPSLSIKKKKLAKEKAAAKQLEEDEWIATLMSNQTRLLAMAEARMAEKFASSSTYRSPLDRNPPENLDEDSEEEEVEDPDLAIDDESENEDESASESEA